MRVAAGLLVVVLPGLASPAAADDTVAFLGAETTWRRARLSLLEPAWPGGPGVHEVHVEGSGRAVVRRTDRGRERRHELTLPAQEARALLRLAAEVDVLAARPLPERGPQVCERWLALALLNDRGVPRSVGRWAGQHDPAFARVDAALRALGERVAAAGRLTYQGEWEEGWRPFEALEVWVGEPGGETLWRELTRDDDLAAVRARLRDLPRALLLAPGERRVLRARGVPGFPARAVVVQGGTLAVDGVVHEDACGLEAWLRGR